jgi:signal transduction histidine kinase
LRRRLPLGFAIVLFAVVAAVTGIGWRGVRASAFQAISDRLDGAVARLANLFTESTQNTQADLSRLATDTAVVRFVATGANPGAVDRVLASHNHPQLVAAELLSRTGERLRTFGPDTTVRGLVPDWPMSGAPLTGFTDWAGAVVYARAAPVVVQTDTLGFVTEWRRLSGGGALLALIRDLIGHDAQFLIGIPGGTWTDLSTAQAGPPVELQHGVTIHAVLPGDDARVGQARPLGNGPWWVWVGFPDDYVYEQSAAFLQVMAVVGLLLVLLGVWLGWRVSQRITQSLATLATVADTIASGALGTRAPVEGDAELRQLAGAFNRMADQVEAAQHRLEQRVSERTAELHAAQHQLVRRERLAILGQLASGVGHELRNPLGVMNNAVYYLHATLKDAPPKVTEYLGILRQQVTLSEKIVSDLLDFARVREPQRAAVTIRDIVEAQLARAAVPDAVTVTRRFPPIAQTVSVDAVQVGQIVFNLLVNAVQAMEGSGHLTLTVEPNGALVRLLVTDTGTGIEEAHRPLVFEPLFTTKARGIGLGLAVSRGLAEVNGGRLDVEATGSTGTTFVLELPVEGAAR